MLISYILPRMKNMYLLIHFKFLNVSNYTVGIKYRINRA